MADGIDMLGRLPQKACARVMESNITYVSFRDFILLIEREGDIISPHIIFKHGM
ncbi:hypothetical protein [Sphingobium fuliginis]|uniref:hypothetical protein n=1 Tax=Sphingobium fuliginis (strain ATCC 27551) TaxID=336203 RepID=UPI001C3FB5F5|nr:hypothetical protein [Sphingobium fuliginis]